MRPEGRGLAAGAAAGLALGAILALGAPPGRLPLLGAMLGRDVAWPAGPPSPPPRSFAELVAQVSPAVVSIAVRAGGASPAPGAASARTRTAVPHPAGAGFLIHPDGYVVTNHHLVAGADEIWVTPGGGTRLAARVVGRDPATDLAVLKLPGQGFPYLVFADRARPRVGDWVIAVGDPFGLQGSASAGIVSADARELGQAYVSFLQIDAPINRGNSGGPTFDIQGRVIGVNTAIISPSGGAAGVGLAIPAEIAERVTRELIEHGEVVRGYLGVATRDLTFEEARGLGLTGRDGALILRVVAGSPAAQARLRPGDVVVALGDRSIRGAAALTRRLARARPAATMRLSILRAREPLTLAVSLGRRPHDAQARQSGVWPPDPRSLIG